jgi:hypothetical protein
MQSSLPAEVTGRNIKSEDIAASAEAAKIVEIETQADTSNWCIARIVGGG